MSSSSPCMSKSSLFRRLSSSIHSEENKIYSILEGVGGFSKAIRAPRFFPLRSSISCYWIGLTLNQFIVLSATKLSELYIFASSRFLMLGVLPSSCVSGYSPHPLSQNTPKSQGSPLSLCPRILPSSSPLSFCPRILPSSCVSGYSPQPLSQNTPLLLCLRVLPSASVPEYSPPPLSQGTL
jgi:hypothetical protein